jgi:predicted nucleic acid-binding Zn ribbon protein
MARSEPKSLESLLPRVLARLAGESGRGNALAPVWSAVVGAHIARHSSPQVLEGTTLVVSVASAEWARTLEAEAPAVCERLNARLGPGRVTALAFRPEGR